MKFPVTLQFVVEVADGSYWLYEKKTELGVPPYPGLCLRGHCPNIMGPVAGFDNMIRVIVDSADPAEVLCKIQGIREATRTPAEVDVMLNPLGWTRRPEVLHKGAVSLQNQDPIDQLFNP